MPYPFRVTAPGWNINNIGYPTYRRTTTDAENYAVELLKQGAPVVKVTFKGHEIALLTPADLAAVVEGDPSTFIGARLLQPAVTALGDTPALPSGKRQREVLALLQQAQPAAVTPFALFEQLRPYLK